MEMSGSGEKPGADQDDASSSKAAGAALTGDKRYSLEVLDGNQPGQVFPIEKARIIIGRRGCDVNLDDPEISRQHVSIEIHATSATLRDLGSTNGTYILGQRVEQGHLEDNSEFRLGTHQLFFRVTFRAPADGQTS
jgi:pSer/pThr/pTyr-binding forkhead associated (FHA) protein